MTFLSSIVLAALTAAAPAEKPEAEIRNVRISSPKMLLSREKSDSNVLVTGQFRIDMSFAKKTAKKPVARLVCLCSLDGVLWIGQTFLDRPDTVRGMPITAKDSDPASFTQKLDEVAKDSYQSAVYGSPELKRGFFDLGKSVKMPKLLLFRIELWQNGVQVAKYESSHAGLSSYELPDDWHAWKKHPQKFKYAGVR